MTNTRRVRIDKQHPTAYKALIALSVEAEANATAAGLGPLLVELLRIRATEERLSA